MRGTYADRENLVRFSKYLHVRSTPDPINAGQARLSITMPRLAPRQSTVDESTDY